jgi:hypothetical protein
MLIAASAAGTAIMATFSNLPKAQAALAFSFIAFLFLAVSSVLSAMRLFQMSNIISLRDITIFNSA